VNRRRLVTGVLTHASWLGLTDHSSSESTLDHRSGFRQYRSVGPAFRPEPVAARAHGFCGLCGPRRAPRT